MSFSTRANDYRDERPNISNPLFVIQILIYGSLAKPDFVDNIDLTFVITVISMCAKNADTKWNLYAKKSTKYK